MEIKANTLPFIYTLTKLGSNLLAGTETGHVIAFPVKDFKKPKWVLEASLSGVTGVRQSSFNDKLIITAAKDGSFSLWDVTKRHEGAPLFL